MQTPDLSTSPRAVWQLTWPQLVMMYIMFFMTLVPVWTAGRLGADVQAALGMVMQCSLFLTVLNLGLSSGATAAVSQAMGAMRTMRAERYIVATLMICVSLGCIMGLVGIVFCDAILDLVQLPGQIMPTARELMQIFMFGLPFTYLYSGTGVVFRSTRQVIPPLIVSAVLAVIHVFACLGTALGMFGLPELGYTGIAWASVIVNMTGAVINCVLLRRGGHITKAALPTLRWLKAGLPYLIKVSVPAGFASLVWQSGYLVLFILVASVPFESVAALAGLTAGLRIEGLLFMPAMAFNMSASVLVGNCLGAGNRAEARRVSLSLLRTAVIIMCVVAACIWPFRADLADMFSADASTRGYIISYLFYNLLSTPCSIASTVLGGVMVGAGATHLNLMVFGGSFWLIRLPLGLLLGHVLWGNATGVYCAMLISQVLQTMFMLHVFFRGRWMDHSMRAHVHRTKAA